MNADPPPYTPPTFQMFPALVRAVLFGDAGNPVVDPDDRRCIADAIARLNTFYAHSNRGGRPCVRRSDGVEQWAVLWPDRRNKNELYTYIDVENDPIVLEPVGD